MISLPSSPYEDEAQRRCVVCDRFDSLKNQGLGGGAGMANEITQIKTFYLTQESKEKGRQSKFHPQASQTKAYVLSFSDVLLTTIADARCLP